MIEVEQLSKRFPGTLAVDSASFEIPRGEVVGFLGPNGAGKTTTLRILAGVIAPTAGRARVAGLDVRRQGHQVRRRTGYLPESAPLYPELQVSEYLHLVTAARGIARRARPHRIEQVAQLCGLSDMMRRPIGVLSRGYRQRVGLAQAIVHDPEVLLLDEPTTGLDPNQLADIRALIRRIGEEKTVLFSSHIMQEVEAVCGRVLIIHQGRIVADGAPAELRARLGLARSLQVVVGGAPDADAVEARLYALEPIDRLRPLPSFEGHAFEVVAREGVDARPALFECLAAAGWILLELRRGDGDLESLFRHLTAP